MIKVFPRIKKNGLPNLETSLSTQNDWIIVYIYHDILWNLETMNV